MSGLQDLISHVSGINDVHIKLLDQQTGRSTATI
jgi:hypothetical protein